MTASAFRTYAPTHGPHGGFSHHRQGAPRWQQRLSWAAGPYLDSQFHTELKWLLAGPPDTVPVLLPPGGLSKPSGRGQLLNRGFTCDPAMPHLGTHPKELQTGALTNTRTHMLTAA